MYFIPHTDKKHKIITFKRFQSVLLIFYIQKDKHKTTQTIGNNHSKEK